MPRSRRALEPRGSTMTESSLKLSDCTFATDSGMATPVAREDDWAGQCIDGRFEVMSILGGGGYGSVFRVRDRKPYAQKDPMEHGTNGEEYELKLRGASNLSKMSSSSHRDLGLLRFIREYRLGSRMCDPRLVRAHHLGVIPAGHYFTMDLLLGGCLPNTELKVPVPVAVGLGLQILSALDCLHHQNIVHRDIKGSHTIIHMEMTIQCFITKCFLPLI
jgi:eukaryotic-like serine/threonine-protein kinase